MNQNTEIDLLQILSDTVEDYFNIPRGNIKLETRKLEIREPRQIAMTLAVEFLYYRYRRDYSKTKIGIFFNKSHRIVIHSQQKINDLIDCDKVVRVNVIELRTRIKDKLNIN